MKTGKKSLLRYIIIFVISFMVGIFAGKLAVPVSPTSAASDLSVNEAKSDDANIEQKASLEEAVFNDIANIETTPSYYNNGLYMPSVGLYSGVATATVSNNTVQVPASGVAKIGSLLVGHNPGTFSAILGVNTGDIFYLYGQKYQVTGTSVLAVSDNMIFVGQETTTSLANKSGLVLMTCYGSMRDFTLKNGSTYRSASHRFLVYAQAV